MRLPRIPLQQVFRFGLAVFVAVLLWILAANIAAITMANNHLHIADESPEATVAIVLGAGIKDNGTPSDMLRDRLLTAVDLYKAGKVKKILASGDHGTVAHDETNIMKDFLLARDVAPEDIFLDHAGFDTYDTMYRARDIFQVTDVIIITQDFHLRRSIFIARSLGFEAEGVSGDRMEYLGIPYLTAREWIANAKALAQIIIHAKPTYLGEPIPITGDGRVTWD